MTASRWRVAHVAATDHTLFNVTLRMAETTPPGGGGGVRNVSLVITELLIPNLPWRWLSVVGVVGAIGFVGFFALFTLRCGESRSPTPGAP